jgi:hypothetical protein
MQRIYEWRSGFGSSAICIVNAFFESDGHEEEMFDTNTARASFSEFMLDKLRFTYSKAAGDDQKVCLSLLEILTHFFKGISWSFPLGLYFENACISLHGHRRCRSHVIEP